jgi:hypothetical protein
LKPGRFALGGGRFGSHLAIAYGSAVETTDLLELCLEEGVIPLEAAEEMLRTAGSANGSCSDC